jgi:hypothetical protein
VSIAQRAGLGWPILLLGGALEVERITVARVAAFTGGSVGFDLDLQAPTSTGELAKHGIGDSAVHVCGCTDEADTDGRTAT